MEPFNYQNKTTISKENKPHQGELFEVSPKQSEHEYAVLSGHVREDGAWVSLEKLKTDYLRYTDKLIGHLDGTLEEDAKPMDAVIYLDKSARPVSWLVDELWEDLARSPHTSFGDNKVPKKPKRMFLNIDKNQWNAFVDPKQVGDVDLSNLPKETLDSLQQLLQISSGEADPFAGKKVLIVDEVGVTGATLHIAEEFIRHAAPNAKITGLHWMQPGIFSDNQGRRNLDVPVWYNDKTNLGRGIGNRDVDSSKNSNSEAQRIGRWFLSNRLKAPDPLSESLRKDLRLLADELRSGKLLFTPSPEREVDDVIERATSINQISIEEYKAKKAAQALAEQALAR